MKTLRRILLGCALLQTAASSHACTVCDSPNGHALRAGLFDGHFLHTSLLVMAPAPVLAAAVALLPLFLPRLLPHEAVSDTLTLVHGEAAE